MKYSLKNCLFLFLLSLTIAFPFIFKDNFQIKSILVSIGFVFIFSLMFKKVGLIFLNIISLFFLFQQLVFYFTANSFINSFYFITIFSTNLDEIDSFFHTLSFLKIFIILSIFIINLLISFFAITKITFKQYNKKYLILIIAFNLLLLNVMYKNLKKHVFVMHCIHSIDSALKITFLDPLGFKKVKIDEKDSPKVEILVLVIGESSSQSHYSLFGYQTNITNPLLGKRTDLLTFNNVLSVGPNTQPNVKTLLSGKIAENEDSLSNDLISVSKELGYTTYYIDNNKFARYDPLVALAKRADYYWNLNGIAKTEDHIFLDSHLSFDEEITPYFERALKEKNDKKLIILHMSGSHPAQYKRYPEKWKQFNHFYDNSILYTDYVLNTWIDLFTIYSNRKNTAFIMLSDHGVEFPADCDPTEKVVEGLKSFGANDHYLSSISVPMLVWLSPQFKSSYATEYQHLQHHKNTPLDSRVLYPTVMHLIGAKVIENKSVQELSILNSKVNFLPRMNYDKTNIDEAIKAGKVCLTPGFQIN